MTAEALTDDQAARIAGAMGWTMRFVRGGNDRPLAVVVSLKDGQLSLASTHSIEALPDPF